MGKPLLEWVTQWQYRYPPKSANIGIYFVYIFCQLFVYISIFYSVCLHFRFSEGQRTFATIVLAMSLPLGIVLGQGVTPLFVHEPKDIKMMNIIWFIPAALTQIMFLFTVRTSKPPTPPNKSAEVDQESIPYITR